LQLVSANWKYVFPLLYPKRDDILIFAFMTQLVQALSWMLATNPSVDVQDGLWVKDIALQFLHALHWFACRRGNTPLHVAVQARAHDIMKLLISNGASIEATNHMCEFTKMAHFLTSKCSLGCWCFDVIPYLRNETALHLASKHGHTAAAQILLDAGASTTTRDVEHLRTALHVAVSHKRESVALLLTSCSTLLDITDDNHETPLHLAVKKSSTAVVSALVQAKADIESENIDGLTPLHLACSHDGRSECLDVLLNSGANANSVDILRWGPLHQASRHGSRSAIARLISIGATVDAVDRELRTPLYLAVCGGHEDCVAELLNASASVSACDRSNRTSLHMAALQNHTEIARRLLASGADADAKDINLMTPLHFAAQLGHDAVIELLINSHADTNALDVNQYSPFHWAAAKDHTSCATQLLEAGISSANRKNGCEIAKSRGHFKIADAIVRTAREPEEALSAVLNWCAGDVQILTKSFYYL
jgi:ankyrin repeat protein